MNTFCSDTNNPAPIKSIRSGEKILFLDEIKIMGILNLTPDSFYDGSRYINNYQNQIKKMIADGADIIDIGAMSSKPGAVDISPDEEIDRLGNVIEWISKEFPQQWISIDTYRSEVAKIAFQQGADILNDISAFSIDEQLISIVSSYKKAYVLMHMRGNPGNMQNNTVYQNLGCEIYDFFINKIKILIQNGISEIILDPGFGFGKSLEDNYKLLASMHFFNSIHYISLLGLSRKSMIYKTLNLNPSDVLNGTTALHGISFHQNPQILRVHDVKEAKEAIKIWNIYKKMT